MQTAPSAPTTPRLIPTYTPVRDVVGPVVANAIRALRAVHPSTDVDAVLATIGTRARVAAEAFLDSPADTLKPGSGDAWCAHRWQTDKRGFPVRFYRDGSDSLFTAYLAAIMVAIDDSARVEAAPKAPEEPELRIYRVTVRLPAPVAVRVRRAAVIAGVPTARWIREAALAGRVGVPGVAPPRTSSWVGTVSLTRAEVVVLEAASTPCGERNEYIRQCVEARLAGLL